MEAWLQRGGVKSGNKLEAWFRNKAKTKNREWPQNGRVISERGQCNGGVARQRIKLLEVELKKRSKINKMLCRRGLKRVELKKPELTSRRSR